MTDQIPVTTLRFLLDTLSKKVSDLDERQERQYYESQTRLIAIDKDVTHLDDRVQSISRKLFGNGQPGVLQTMERRIGELEKIVWRVSGALALLTLAINLLLIFLK